MGDTLFPVTSLAAGFSQDFAPTAHLFVRLRVFHPGIAVAAIGLLLFAVGRAMKRTRAQVIQNIGLTVIGLAVVQLMLGAMNLVLLAPVAMQLIHLLVADLLWIAAILVHRRVFQCRRLRFSTAIHRSIAARSRKPDRRPSPFP